MISPPLSLFSGRAPGPRAPLPGHSTPDVARPARRPVVPSPALPPGTATALRQAMHLPPRLREALALACDERRGIRTVERLASAAGCDRRTLWTHWKAAVGSELRLQDFVHWLLLLRATHRKHGELAWADVADEIGIHPHTLSRLARQLTGCSLRDLAADGHAELVRRFEAEVLALVLRTDGTGPQES
ncbi:MAG: helix-turn-helix transcriptional regulator [Longimicrobiaceae bacterium]